MLTRGGEYEFMQITVNLKYNAWKKYSNYSKQQVEEHIREK
jgi:hypothetical protein